MTDLLPCPFCIINDPEVKFLDGSWYVECGHCGARGPSGFRETDAIEDWNRRVPDKQAGGGAAINERST